MITMRILDTMKDIINALMGALAIFLVLFVLYYMAILFVGLIVLSGGHLTI